jgi:hypothetical protein
MGLTKEEQQSRRESANAFIQSNQLSSCEIKDFISTYFTHEVDGYDFPIITTLPVKDYIKDGETFKTGTKSAFTLDDYIELTTTNKVVGKGNNGKDWKMKIGCKDAEYWEIRPNLNNQGKTMCIIDFDGYKSSGDIAIDELFEVDNFPEELEDSAFFLSRTKSLPHFVVWVDGIPQDIKLGQYIGVLKDFEGDILFNHSWERVENKLYNVGSNCELTTIKWDTVLSWLNPDNKQAKKLFPKKVKETKPLPKKAKTEIDDDDTSTETQSVSSSNTEGENIAEDCAKIKEVFEAILKISPDFFNKYDMWMKLGFIIYNQTKGSDEGCDLFYELSHLCESVKKKPTANECSKQYNATQKCRKKEDKIHLPSLYKWLSELDPNHPLVLQGQESRLMSGEMTADEIRLTKNYQDYRIIFQKTNFKLNNPIRYCELINDKKKGKYIITRTREEFLERNRDIEGMPVYLVKGGIAPKQMKFHHIWLDDVWKQKYSHIKFDPTDTKEELEEGQDQPYNAFCGWINDKCAEPIKEEDSDFIKLMKHLLVEEKVFEYYKCWLASIIQRPHIKTKVAPILYSKTHGTGKNSLVDGSIAIIGKQLSACVECIEDITKNFNAHLCNKLFIYGDEICANAKKVADKLKAVITRPTTNLEKKGVDAIEVDDLTNWIFTSNNENNIKVEEGDRRFLMIRCREEKQTKYSKAMYDEIGDPLKLARLFAFFKTYEQSEESIAKYGKFNIGMENVIETEYKKEMIYEHRSAYIQILYKSTRDLVGTKYSASKLYEVTQEWAKKHYCSANYTVQEFSKHSQKYIGCFKKKTNTGNRYEFPSTKTALLKHLYEVDEPYYRYINQLEDDFIPDFKEPDEIEANPLAKDQYGNLRWNQDEE